MKRITLILISCLILLADMKGQDPQFTQFYSVPLYLSPSFAGATQQHRIASSYRNQWLGIPGGFATYVLSYDYYFSKYNSGLGVLVLRDQAGSGNLGFINTSIVYAYDFRFYKEWHVRPGLGFMYSIYSLDFSSLKFRDQIINNDPNNDNPQSWSLPPSGSVGNIDGSVSTMIYNPNIWLGVTVDHLLLPNISFYGGKTNVPLKFTAYGGIKLITKGKLLKPSDESVSLAFQYRQMGDNQQLDIGLYWFKVPLVLGVWYRGIPQVNSVRGDAISFLTGYKTSRFSVGYSYDFTVSGLINSTAGAHELSVIWEFQTERKKRRHAIPCPEF